MMRVVSYQLPKSMNGQVTSPNVHNLVGIFIICSAIIFGAFPLL